MSVAKAADMTSSTEIAFPVKVIVGPFSLEPSDVECCVPHVVLSSVNPKLNVSQILLTTSRILGMELFYSS